MYLPPHFDEQRLPELHALMRAHPLACLVTQHGGALDANHLPVELAADEGPLGTLRAHAARANALTAPAADGGDVLVIFRGPQAYISPNWYPSKHEAHKLVPTWNYEVVHAHGRLRLRDDERFLRGLLARLTRTHEAGEPRPWKMGDAPPEHIAQLLTTIVGLEIEITRLEGKRKLSQNREERDRRGAIEALEAKGEAAVAAAMKTTLPS